MLYLESSLQYSWCGVESLGIARTWSGILEGRHKKPGGGCGSSADFQRKPLINLCKKITTSNQPVVLTLFSDSDYDTM